MNQQEILNIHKKISNLLIKKQLKDALNTLDLFLHSLQNWSFSEKKIELENNYKLMLQYAVDGVQDPDRHLVYNKLITSIYALADEAKEALLLRDSNSYEYQQIRMYQAVNVLDLKALVKEMIDTNINIGLTELVENETVEAQRKEFRRKYENLQIELFNKIWLTLHFSEDEVNFIKDQLTDDEIDVDTKCLFVSALTLNVLRSFDETKVLLLFHFYSQKHEQMKQRALIGIMLAMYLYNSRLSLYPAIRNRLVIEADDDDFKKNVQFIIIQFIRSQETENISKKLKEEILPEMMKMRPMLGKKIDFEDVNSIEDFEEKNPDWQEMIEKSGVGDKLKELSELQIEGADVFMSTFSSLKTFPFFNVMSNWFLPFSPKNSVVQGLFNPKEKSFLYILLNSGYMCNSDKYSFCLSLSQVSESQRKMMTSSFRMESEQMEELKKDENLLKSTANKETLSNQYLQDLYRFYKLFYYKNHFVDIFSLPLDFQNTWFYKNIGFGKNDLREIAEYYFSKNRCKEALDIYLQLLETNKDNAELCQKAGYCYQHLGNIESALEYYLCAETILTDNKWTVKRIAFCYRVLKNYEKALEYYSRAQTLIPDSISIQLNMGHCLLALKRYQEALNMYYKIELTSPDNVKVWRAIAWCAFLSQKLDRAQKYYAKLLEYKSDHNDLLNAGHVEWAMGNRKQALEYYKMSIEHNNGNLSEFLSEFEKDIPDLLTFPEIKEDEIPIMTDRLKYML
ncbi:tetratricopeptide repeat protein [Bacteroidales bacterium OttesenSCG-928-I21]|nr:tetratricopeptide repeat protein [Bacteroidales bacterium OttesenSCG-928-I21]